MRDLLVESKLTICFMQHSLMHVKESVRNDLLQLSAMLDTCRIYYYPLALEMDI